MTDWNDFYVAAAGASAALLGLIFVAISINLKDILSVPGLDLRACIALTLLLAVVVVSLVLLVPINSAVTRGVVVLFAGIFFWAVALLFDVRLLRAISKEYLRHQVYNFFVNQLSLLCYVVSGAFIAAGNQNGIFLIAAGIVVSFIKSVVDAWVLLVEIIR